MTYRRSVGNTGMHSRIFERIHIAKCGSTTFHPFFIERFAYKLWNNRSPFLSGPSIIAEPSVKEYGFWTISQTIDNSLRYFMKPHKVLTFATHDIMDTNRSHILTRAWLNATEESNTAVLLMERIRLPEDTQYMEAINNTTWQPDNIDDLENAKELHQSLTLVDTQYKQWAMKLE